MLSIVLRMWDGRNNNNNNTNTNSRIKNVSRVEEIITSEDKIKFISIFPSSVIIDEGHGRLTNDEAQELIDHFDTVGKLHYKIISKHSELVMFTNQDISYNENYFECNGIHYNRKDYDCYILGPRWSTAF